MLSRFRLIPERYGQTDRFAISISRVSMLTRDKNRTTLFGYSIGPASLPLMRRVASLDVYFWQRDLQDVLCGDSARPRW